MKKEPTLAAIQAFAEGDAANMLAAITPGGIEAQEARGQRALNKAGNLLPKKLLYSMWEEVEAMGIKLIGEQDDLFLNVELPPGWMIQPTPHSMWSNVVDETGKVRLEVFYKAAFYDRKAHFWIKKEEGEAR